MSDHLVLYVDCPVPAAAVTGSEPPSQAPPEAPGADAAGPSCSVDESKMVEKSGCSGEEEPLVQMAECRICQEEDSVHNLETPCACSGSLKV